VSVASRYEPDGDSALRAMYLALRSPGVPWPPWETNPQRRRRVHALNQLGRWERHIAKMRECGVEGAFTIEKLAPPPLRAWAGARWPQKPVWLIMPEGTP